MDETENVLCFFRCILHFVTSVDEHFEMQVGDGTLTASQLPRLVVALEGHHISRVACGSAHTVAWSCGPSSGDKKARRRSPARLPQSVPLEYNSLQSVPMPLLRNRLMLLNQFSGCDLIQNFCNFVVVQIEVGLNSKTR